MLFLVYLHELVMKSMAAFVIPEIKWVSVKSYEFLNNSKDPSLQFELSPISTTVVLTSALDLKTIYTAHLPEEH